MQQRKKEQSKSKRKHYSDEELTALGIYKEKDQSDEDENDDSSEQS